MQDQLSGPRRPLHGFSRCGSSETSGAIGEVARQGEDDNNNIEDASIEPAAKESSKTKNSAVSTAIRALRPRWSDGQTLNPSSLQSSNLTHLNPDFSNQSRKPGVGAAVVDNRLPLLKIAFRYVFRLA